MKTEWEKGPICQFLQSALKIFQIIRLVCGKKIDNNPYTYLVSKIAYFDSYDQYKLCFQIIFSVDKILKFVFVNTEVKSTALYAGKTNRFIIPNQEK